MRKKLSASQVTKKIQSRNRDFDQATVEQKRVLIAKDVLVQIAVGMFIPTSGQWARLPMNYRIHANTNASLQTELLGRNLSSCDCCGVGALFLSCTLYNNETTVYNTIYGDNLGRKIAKKLPIENKLTEYFSQEQLTLIELAFEGAGGSMLRKMIGNGELETNLSTDELYAANEFYIKRSNEGWSEAFSTRIRLEEIMENIIRNGGTFVP